MSERNGSHNTASAREEQRIAEEKEKLFLTLTVEPCNILSIVSVAWAKSFTKIDITKSAISECEWFLFNQNYDIFLLASNNGKRRDM